MATMISEQQINMLQNSRVRTPEAVMGAAHPEISSPVNSSICGSISTIDTASLVPTVSPVPSPNSSRGGSMWEHQQGNCSLKCMYCNATPTAQKHNFVDLLECFGRAPTNNAQALLASMLQCAAFTRTGEEEAQSPPPYNPSYESEEEWEEDEESCYDEEEEANNNSWSMSMSSTENLLRLMKQRPDYEFGSDEVGEVAFWDGEKLIPLPASPVIVTASLSREITTQRTSRNLSV